jgi:probable F420-dependent oxidoreductase
MPKIELGRVGAVLNPGDGDAFIGTAVELDELGYPTIWLSGGELHSLSQIADAVRATSRARIATSIISVDRFPADQVAALYSELAASHPGRFVAGLGGAHGANPLQTLTEYLARLDQVPQQDRVLAALGPKMLDLAREHAAGALPVLITPDRTAAIRSHLGDATTLAVDQLAVVETDPARARAIARGPLGFLGKVPAYQASFRRMGFTDEEITGLADRLVDALVPWGDAAAVATAVRAQLQAGADHVALALTFDPSAPASTRPWRDLAGLLL